MEIQDEQVSPGFDLIVTKRDPKSGLIVSRTPYTLRVIGDAGGSKMQLFERPIGSGNLYNKQGQPIGRWVIDEKTKRGKFIENAPHVAFIPPETDDQKLARSLTEKDARIKELEKEVESIRAEAKKKSGS